LVKRTDDGEHEMSIETIRALYVNGSEHDVQVLRERLAKFEGARFEIVWHESAEKAIQFLEEQNVFDVIVIEDVVQGTSGVEITHKLKELKYNIPIVFLTTNKDVGFAVEVMRMGVKDYLLKEDVVSHVFPQTLLRVVEKGNLRLEQEKLELKQKRLEIMQEIVVGISDKIGDPLQDMNRIVTEIEMHELPEKTVKYLKLIKDNVERMQVKLEKLRNLKDDKTVKYIKDIKMIDLS
ncbi:MAG: response regulator, partial [Ignavibacteriae bacterium]